LIIRRPAEHTEKEDAVDFFRLDPVKRKGPKDSRSRIPLCCATGSRKRFLPITKHQASSITKKKNDSIGMDWETFHDSSEIEIQGETKRVK
jgi:hypothetical protein